MDHRKPHGREVVRVAAARHWWVGAGLLLAAGAAGLVAAWGPFGVAVPAALAGLLLVAGLIVCIRSGPRRIVLDESRRRLRAGVSPAVPFDAVRSVVLFTAAAEGQTPRETRRVYVVVAGARPRRSRLRREIARWGAVSPAHAAYVLDTEAEAARQRTAKPAAVERLLNGRERLVSRACHAPAAWTVARRLALTLEVPLVHHAGHVGVVPRAELSRPLATRAAAAGRVGAPADESHDGLLLTVEGAALVARWLEPGRGGQAAGLHVDDRRVAIWRGAPTHTVATFDADALTDVFLLPAPVAGLALATATDHAMLRMPAPQAAWLRRRLREHLAWLHQDGMPAASASTPSASTASGDTASVGAAAGSPHIYS